MHWPALARPQRRTIRGRRARARALENRLAWNWASRSRTHGATGAPGVTEVPAGGAGRKGALYTGRGPVCGTIIRGGGATGVCGAVGAAGRAAMMGACGAGAAGRTGGAIGVVGPATGRGGTTGGAIGSGRRWRHWSCGLRRSGRRRGRKSWPRARSRNYKFRRSRRRRSGGRRLRRGNGRGWRSGRNGRLGLDGGAAGGGVSANRRSLLLADDGPESVTGLGNIREVDLGLDFIAVGASRPGRPTGTLRRAGNAETGTHFVRFMVFERTGMALLLGDSDFGKHIENGLAFDFQLSCQIVDSNLAHPPFRPPDCSAKSSYQPRASVFRFAHPLRSARKNRTYCFSSEGAGSSVDSAVSS